MPSEKSRSTRPPPVRHTAAPPPPATGTDVLKAKAPALRVGPTLAAGGRVLHRGDGILVGEVEDLCVVLWRTAVTRASFERQRAGLDEVIRTHPNGVGFLCIIESTCKPPDDGLRRASIEMLASQGDHLKCIAVVIEGEGFGAALARGVISGMALLRPRGTPASSFSHVRDSLEWAADYVHLKSIEKVFAFIEATRNVLDVIPE